MPPELLTTINSIASEKFLPLRGCLTNIDAMGLRARGGRGIIMLFNADPMCRHLWLREKASDVVHKIRLVSRGFAVIDPQPGHAANNYSLQARGEYIIKLHPASETVELARTVDETMREAFNLCLGAGLTRPSIHVVVSIFCRASRF
jgi:hypothetical protein